MITIRKIILDESTGERGLYPYLLLEKANKRTVLRQHDFYALYEILIEEETLSLLYMQYPSFKDFIEEYTHD